MNIEQYNNKQPRSKNGMTALLVITLGLFGAIALFVWGIFTVQGLGTTAVVVGTIMIVVGGVLGFLVFPTLYCGLKIINPNEALVLTLFGQFYGVIQEEGFYYINPFCGAVNPTKGKATLEVDPTTGGFKKVNPKQNKTDNASGKAVSLKVMTLNNEKQKVNDKLGNPIEIGVVVIWKVLNPVKAVMDVDDYMEFLSIQADSSLRNIVLMYPYDLNSDRDSGDELTLRGSSLEVAERLKMDLQDKVGVAGLEIVETRITRLSYAPEIAAVMLQRQQASAIIDARKLIVEGAVGMVEMALTKLSEKEIVQLDDERKAAMVSNLLVVLCGSKETQPIINSGSLY